MDHLLRGASVGNEEWERIILRRGQLIYKKNREGLTQEEWNEYEDLERIVDVILEVSTKESTNERKEKGVGL